MTSDRASPDIILSVGDSFDISVCIFDWSWCLGAFLFFLQKVGEYWT